jgi:hypothetical protein
MPLALTGANGLHRAIQARLQARRLAAPPAFDVDATCECSDWQPGRERNMSAALDFGELSTIEAVFALNTRSRSMPL